MKLNAITFAPDAEGEQMPDTVTVTLTKKEVAFLLVATGSSPNDANEMMHGGAVPSSAIYNCLTGGVINPYYEDGLNSLLASLVAES